MLFIWCLLLYTLFAHRLFGIDGALHHLELSIMVMYYVWSTICLALEVGTGIEGLPSGMPYIVAAKKSEIAMLHGTLTKIDDGQIIHCTGCGFLMMVCRFYEERQEDKDRAAEKSHDSQDLDDQSQNEQHYYNYGRWMLLRMWKLQKLQDSLPWITPTKDADQSIPDQELVYEFEVVKRNRVNKLAKWEHNNRIGAYGVQLPMDFGQPTYFGELVLVLVAALNATLGILHRYAINTEPLGDEWLDKSRTLAMTVVVFACSHQIYRSLYCVAFTWYTCLLFMVQFEAVTEVHGAYKKQMPYYIDLRHEGNLETWYTARDYLNAYGKMHIFGQKNEIIVLSALVAAAAVSINAIFRYFSDANNVDWTDPGGLISLLNMILLGMFLFLSLFAMERINHTENKLLRKLEAISVTESRDTAMEISKRERLKELQEKDDADYGGKVSTAAATGLLAVAAAEKLKPQSGIGSNDAGRGKDTEGEGLIELHGQIAKNTEQLAGMKEVQVLSCLVLYIVLFDYNYTCCYFYLTLF